MLILLKNCFVFLYFVFNNIYIGFNLKKYIPITFKRKYFFFGKYILKLKLRL